MPDRSANFYHGTVHAIKDGMVRPANDVDKEPSEYSLGDPGDMSEGDHAFVTHDEEYAWKAAHTFHKNGARPRVYETDSAPDMKPGPWNKDHPDFAAHIYGDDPGSSHAQKFEDLTPEEVKENHQPEFGSPTGFPVRARIDIMPGHQGTFANTNWNSYRSIHTNQAPEPHGPRDQKERVYAMRSGGKDLNHPSDSDIKYGTGNTHADAQEKAIKMNGGPKLPQAVNLRQFMEAKEGTMHPPDRNQLKLF